jgi:hypothetical protein
MRNYFKSTVGTVSERTIREETFFFDDESPDEARGAFAAARAAHGGRGSVVVWKRAMTVPVDVRQVGDVADKDDWSPIVRRSDRRYEARA